MSGAANNPYFEISREPSRDDLLRIMTAPNAVANGRASSGASHKEVLCNMTNKRYFAGGTLSPGLPKGGVEHDRAKYGRSMPVQDRRLLADREPHEPCPQLARHKLGAGAEPHADGGQRYLPRGQRGRRSTAYAHCVRDSVPSASAPRMGNQHGSQRINAICTNSSLRQVRQHKSYDPSSGWR